MDSSSDTQDAPELNTRDRANIVAINSVIRRAARELRERHPWLKHQSAIGLGILLTSALVMGGNAYLHATGLSPAWVAVTIGGIAASIAHEVEHDLIHKLYFRGTAWANAAMMLLGWVLRPNTINPWARRHMHLKHHQLSGTEQDLEERAITNGERYDIKRLVMMADGILAALLRIDQAGKRKKKLLMLVAASYFPLGWVHFGLWYTFLMAHAASALGFALPSTLVAHVETLDVVVTVWIAPNVVRSFCLNFVSSSMHYYGDVQARNVMQQTQILNPLWMIPFQVFCFNFGSTHAIHHFVANEPFYVRQWTAKAAHDVMREHGIPHNDLGTFTRANRRTQTVTALQPAAQAT